MSRLVMLPNARRVPEFPPVSASGNSDLCLAAYRACQSRMRLRPKAPEADYLAAVRGIISGQWPVVAKHHTGCGSRLRPGGGPGRAIRAQKFSGPAEGGNRHHCRQPGCLAHTARWADMEEIGQVDGGAQDVAAIELSS